MQQTEEYQLTSITDASEARNVSCQFYALLAHLVVLTMGCKMGSFYCSTPLKPNNNS